LDESGKSIWIDLDNAPHVPLFAPIIRHFRESGVNVVLTVRDHAQTVELLRLKGFESTFEVIGRHYGKGKLAKIRGLILRALQLRSYIRKLQADGVQIAVAISHGSRSMVLAARWLKIPVLTMYDYEYTETRIFNRLSDIVLVPDAIPDPVLDSIGLAESKRRKYPGIKEELYLKEFRPDADFRQKFLENLDQEDRSGLVLAVARPPATTANYHAGDSELLLAAVLRHLLSDDNTYTVIVPRSTDQAKNVGAILSDMDVAAIRYHILDEGVDGSELANAADLLISGGGTMNREAALLGVPVYSIFTGKQGALDAEMERAGVIRFIRNDDDVRKIELKRRSRDAGIKPLTDRVKQAVIEQINYFLKTS
jgi:predicted glycosyltransferase